MAWSKVVQALFLGASLLAVSCLYACAPKAEPVMARPAAAPTPSLCPTECPDAMTPFDKLCACAWMDRYDRNYILTFDKINGKMTERNEPAGIKHSSRISVETNTLHLYDELGVLIASLPYTLEEDRLCIDYGEALGVLEYRAIR
ncbi:MAG: hypothetical protein VB049_05135 [Candidatus Pelethousia sp.]|nr:hypothetical protein [Candidatus Pelethousia sp.]